MKQRYFFIAAVLLLLGLGAIARSKLNSPRTGEVRIEAAGRIGKATVVRGTPVQANYLLRNDTLRKLTIAEVKTGCGCAILVSGEKSLVGASLPINTTLPVTLQIDTTNRPTGDFAVRFQIVLLDDSHNPMTVGAVQEISVNPGWVASQSNLTLSADTAVDQMASAEFVLYQTSVDHPFQIDAASIQHPLANLELIPITADNARQDSPPEATSESKWRFVPRYRVRVSIPTSALKRRERTQLTLAFSHQLTRLGMNVEMIPAAKPLKVTPDQIYIDRTTGKSSREFVVSTQCAAEMLQIELPLGVIVLSKQRLGDEMIKVSFEIRTLDWDGKSIVISDPNGNRETVKLELLR